MKSLGVIYSLVVVSGLVAFYVISSTFNGLRATQTVDYGLGDLEAVTQPTNALPLQDARIDDLNGAALGVNFYQGATDGDRILQ